MIRWMRDAASRCMSAGHEWLAADDPEACPGCLGWALAAAHREGQEAMRERCAAACDRLRQHVNPQACTCTTSRHHSPYCEGWQDALDYGESAIRALALEVGHD